MTEKPARIMIEFNGIYQETEARVFKEELRKFLLFRFPEKNFPMISIQTYNTTTKHWEFE